jgi:membrane protein DedA with SNARE-associated domain
MDFLTGHFTYHFFQTYGYWAIFFLIAGESMGIALPGETALLAASVYAGRTHHLSIFLIILAAASGALIGDNIGYTIGYFGGFRLLRRFGKYIGVDNAKIKLGRYLFFKYGGRIVFFGRFVAILRILAALLAGVNRMHWRRFLFFNAMGGLMWATIDGTAGYFLGKEVHRLSLSAGIVTFSLATLVVIAYTVYLHNHLHKLEKEAEKTFPGPIE